MRGWAVASWVALALVLVSGVASAHPAATTVTADDDLVEVPAQGFEEAFCLPLCNTQARGQGNLPPVIVTESGTTLTWQAIGGYHSVTSDTETTVDQEADTVYLAPGTNEDGEICLDAPIGPGDLTEVLFEIRDDGLYVTDLTRQEPVAVRCDEAGAHPDGSYTLKTHCDVHPKFQHQLIHVVPAGTV